MSSVSSVDVTITLFKSNHSGIETINSRLFIIKPSTFKSNHSGIETSMDQSDSREFSSFKSNHSGIETDISGNYLRRGQYV